MIITAFSYIKVIEIYYIEMIFIQNLRCNRKKYD